MTNTNPTTGIRYGIISSHSLHPEVIDEIQQRGTDVHFESSRKDMDAALRGAIEDYLPSWAVDDVAQKAWDLYEGFDDDEPVHEFELDGVKGRTTWLGGALLVWIFESPHVVKAKLCSPSVPNCTDQDHPDNDGEWGYAPPPDWYAEEHV